MACTRNHLLSAFCSTLALSDRLCIRKRVNFPTVVGSQEWSVIFVRWKESDCRELSALINNLLMRSANDMSNAYSLYSSQRKLWFAEIPWLVYVSFPRWKTDAAGTTQIAKLNGTTHPSYLLRRAIKGDRGWTRFIARETRRKNDDGSPNLWT